MVDNVDKITVAPTRRDAPRHTAHSGHGDLEPPAIMALSV